MLLFCPHWWRSLSHESSVAPGKWAITPGFLRQTLQYSSRVSSKSLLTAHCHQTYHHHWSYRGLYALWLVFIKASIFQKSFLFCRKTLSMTWHVLVQEKMLIVGIAQMSISGFILCLLIMDIKPSSSKRWYPMYALMIAAIVLFGQTGTPNDALLDRKKLLTRFSITIEPARYKVCFWPVGW